MDHLYYFCLVFVMLSCASVWSLAGKGLTSWLLFVVSISEFVTFTLVSCVRFGA